MLVAPSLLTADFLHLEKDVRMVDEHADLIHLDIMDGTLVPNISFGFPVVAGIASIATKPLDAHLMVVNPDKWFERLKELGVQYVSFHIEASGCRTGRFIRQAHKLGFKVGVALNPDVKIEKVFKYVGKADFILVMSVFAGFGGQKFIYETIDRVTKLKAEIVRKGAQTLIEVDGGVNPSNIKALAEAGADIVVGGSAVLGAQDPAAVIKALQEA
ncbi:MAG: ribulose-phosphate 3-epimerase [Bacteroidales bacterium]|nr:ribulose-phosphate 3-epimerase [Bacteroidales bacterium]